MASERPPSVARSEPAGPVIDRGVLGQLVADLGIEPVRDVCLYFLGDARHRVTEIGAALERDDAGTAATAAHRLKSAAGFVGAARLAARCTSLERLLRSGGASSSEARSWSAPLVEAYERTSDEMVRVLGDLAASPRSAATP
ncbi:MAG: Hpt domain-containing protein [Acidimicrobiales bacterium]